ncbi:MAG TPA: hypothetical protein VG099_04525, partial [Gemmataceae bacterium]|nr:hypothetical protein [Gemmataceae bacterium]
MPRQGRALRLLANDLCNRNALGNRARVHLLVRVRQPLLPARGRLRPLLVPDQRLLPRVHPCPLAEIAGPYLARLREAISARADLDPASRCVLCNRVVKGAHSRRVQAEGLVDRAASLQDLLNNAVVRYQQVHVRARACRGVPECCRHCRTRPRRRQNPANR